jgi:transposase
MTPEKMFHQLLGLGLNWQVRESRFEAADSTVYLELEEAAGLWESARCPKDGGKVFCYDHTELLTWRHLNVFQHRCQITCCLPRGKCRQCGHVFRVRPPWEGLSTHFSREFEAYALLLMREMPMARVAALTGEQDTRLWRILFRHVDAAYAQADFSNVCCVGVDEMALRKGQNYLSVFADLVEKRVIFAVEGHDHHSWEAFVQTLEKHHGDRRAITQASMDMSAGYQKGAKENCRNARIVFDKFHLIAQLIKKVDQVRRAEVRVGGPGVWEALHKTKWIWLKNPGRLTEGQARHFKAIEHKNLCTAKAHQARLLVQDIYHQSGDASVAKRRLEIWCRWVRWIGRHYKTAIWKPMMAMADTIQSHLPGILAHWKSGVTNAFMEALMSVFSAVKRKARGFRSPVYLIALLYFVAGRLRLPQH